MTVPSDAVIGARADLHCGFPWIGTHATPRISATSALRLPATGCRGRRNLERQHNVEPVYAFVPSTEKPWLSPCAPGWRFDLLTLRLDGKHLDTGRNGLHPWIH